MMKRLTIFLCTLSLLFSINALYLLAEHEEATSQQYTAINQEIRELYEMNQSHENCVMTAILQNPVHGDDSKYSRYYGRLYIPDAEIDIALYYGRSQLIVDRVDSAAIYTNNGFSGEVIADHSTQDFHKLFAVKVGTTGYIQLENGDCINIKCVDLYNGHNTGRYLTDEEYKVVMGKHDYLMYTCRNGWMNILVTQWEKY